MLGEETDEELMIAYQLGEAEAFTALYARHAPRVLGFLRKRVKSEAMARDVFQATFLKLHKSRARYDSAFPFVPWLFTICRSELLDALKRPSAREEILVEKMPEPAAHEKAELAEVNFGGLTAAQKEAVELRYGRDFSFEEIARHLNTSLSNARKLVSRAILLLREVYEKR